jgi:hypothetical protein
MSKAAAKSSYQQDMIPTINATDAHTRHFVANGELLLPTLKAFDMCPYDALLEMIDFGLCVAAEMSVAPNNSRSPALHIINNGRTAPNTPTTNHLLACQL